MLLLEHTADIRRSKAVGTNGRSQVQTLYSAVSCFIMPMNHKTIIEHHFSLGLAYEVYFDAGQDVQPGDQLISGGKTYTVKAVENYNVGLVGHVHCYCEQEIA